MRIKLTVRPFIIYVSGAVISSIVALVVLILYWPQNNSSGMVKVTIKQGETLSAISQHLANVGVISNQRTFQWAVKVKGLETNIPAGTFRLKDANNNSTIIWQLVNSVPELKKVTILEGWSLHQLAEYLTTEMGFGINEIIGLSQDNAFINLLEVPSNNLEGYLYPDTYYFFEGDTPRSVLTRLVKEYKKFWTDEIYSQAQEMQMSEQDVVTLASIIEGEAVYDDERSVISAVYHNRLKKGMKLQADPTVQYIIDDGPRRLLNKDLEIDSPYNTYLYNGLPPGPINSPGSKSLYAALYPADNRYLYFVAKGDGYHTFSNTEREHKRAKRAFQKIRRQVRKEQSN